GAEGARVLVLQPDPALRDLFEPVEQLLQDVSLRHDVRLAAAARSVLSEIQFEDSMSALAIDAIMMQMLATAARLERDPKGRRAVPAWLSTVRELLHARFRERITLTELAAAAGVHPCHLSRSFRGHFRVTIGNYVRRLRAECAADLLERTQRPISEIAYETGYSDQSHLTRECRRHFGVGPAKYRRERLR
ncbi:MAG TPA: helix-turn-helix transcriptional regulator, partial [Gemmatimonadaceae bacterium]|nr:helix-turn-helix transcriptional regulator [Gemmatimonadaceae bacterium]